MKKKILFVGNIFVYTWYEILIELNNFKNWKLELLSRKPGRGRGFRWSFTMGFVTSQIYAYSRYFLGCIPRYITASQMVRDKLSLSCTSAASVFFRHCIHWNRVTPTAAMALPSHYRRRSWLKCSRCLTFYGVTRSNRELTYPKPLFYIVFQNGILALTHFVTPLDRFMLFQRLSGFFFYFL